jgi:hypothetical protein
MRSPGDGYRLPVHRSSRGATPPTSPVQPPQLPWLNCALDPAPVSYAASTLRDVPRPYRPKSTSRYFPNLGSGRLTVRSWARHFLCCEPLMSDTEATAAYARRWKALLAEYSAAENKHVDLLSSPTEPFSVGQKAQFMGSTARRKALLQKAKALAREWFDAHRI